MIDFFWQFILLLPNVVNLFPVTSENVRWVQRKGLRNLESGGGGMYIIFFFPMTQQPPVGQDLFIVEDSLSHSDTPHSVGLLWTSDQPVAETST